MMKGVIFVDLSSAKRVAERVEMLTSTSLEESLFAKGWPSQPLPRIESFLIVISGLYS